MAETDLIMNMKYAKNILSLKQTWLFLWLMARWNLERQKNEANDNTVESVWKGSHLKFIRLKTGSVFWLSLPCYLSRNSFSSVISKCSPKFKMQVVWLVYNLLRDGQNNKWDVFRINKYILTLTGSIHISEAGLPFLIL